MKTTRTKVISWLLVLTMVISMISPGNATVAKAEEVIANAASDDYATKLDLITSYLKGQSGTPTIGSEWIVLQQARAGKVDREWYRTYYRAVYDEVADSTDGSLGSIGANAKAVIALRAMGADPSDVNNKDLYIPLADYTEIANQYVTTAIYVLIAMGTDTYEFDNVDVTEITTQDKLITLITEQFTEDGYIGYEWEGVSYPDMDSTAMALQALAPYYREDEYTDVKDLIDKSVEWLSSQQAEDGTFGDYDKACTTAQVLCALSELGIDVETDTRFVKNGKSALDALLSYCDEKGCVAVEGSYSEIMSTEQAGYALVSYSRMKTEANRLYDLTDASDLYRCEEAHSGGTATCSYLANCTVCDTEYGDLDATNHANKEVRGAKEATCTTEGYTGDTYCKDCGQKIATGTAVAKKEHTVVKDAAVAPTETTAGKTEGSHCSVCNTVIVAQTEVPAIGTKNDAEKTLEKPDKTSFKKVVSNKKKQIKITWKKKSGVTGYEIQVSTSSKFKTKQTKKYTIKKASTTSKTIKKLKSKKKYYVRIRTYVTKEIDGENVTKYSKWVKKSVRVK